VIRPLAGPPKNRGSIPGRSKWFNTIPKCPDQSWGTSSLLFNVYWGGGALSPCVKRTRTLNLPLNFTPINGANHHSPICVDGMPKDKYSCLYSRIYCYTSSDGFRLICWSIYCKILGSFLSTNVLYLDDTLRNYNVILQWMHEDMCCCSFPMFAHNQRNCMVCSYVRLSVILYMTSRYKIKKKKLIVQCSFRPQNSVTSTWTTFIRAKRRYV